MGDTHHKSMEDGRSSARDTASSENARLRNEIAVLRARISDLERLADTDTLTPLPNRRAFERETERVVRNVARHGTSAAVMFVDVDGLKSINDAWGHAAGDAALRHVATILRREVRATDIVARIGGDEFGLLLDHLDEASARTKGGALLATVACEPLDFGTVAIDIGLSLGVAMVGADDTAADVIYRADRQMYAIKAAQRSLR